MKTVRKAAVTRRSPALLGALCVTSLVIAGVAAPAGATPAPTLKITPGPYRSGQKINISVGPNRYFTPYSHVNILECADPGGKKSNLPTGIISCDGNTIQGNTILVKKDGSFSERGYVVYALPNVSQLGELASGQPVCSQKKSCVLYIGQNQENFSAPKTFSHPFTVRSSGSH